MKKLILTFSLLLTFPALALTPDQIAQQQLIIQHQQEQARQAQENMRNIREAERRYHALIIFKADITQNTDKIDELSDILNDSFDFEKELSHDWRIIKSMGIYI